MDLNALPFVKSSYTVRRVNGTPTVVVPLGLQQGIAAGAIPQQPNKSKRRALDLDSDFAGHGDSRELPHPSQIKKRSAGSEQGRKRKRKRDDQQGIFDHLTQLRRKQQIMDAQMCSPTEFQAVPASPLLGDSHTRDDASFSFHGNNTPKKAWTYKGGESVSPLEPQFLDDSFNSSFTVSEDHSYQSCYQPLNLHGPIKFGRISSSYTPTAQWQPLQVQRPAYQEFRSPTELGVQPQDIQEPNTSFSVPSLDHEESFGFAEVPSVPQSRHHLLLPPPLLVHPPTDPEPCTLDVASFSIKNFFPREE